MTVASEIQEALANDLFPELGSSVTWEPFVSDSTNKWGDATITYGAPQSIMAVPYSTITNRSWETFGDLAEQETDMIIPYNYSISEKDRITFDGTTYLVRQIEKYPLNGTNVAWAVRLYKDQ